MKKFLKYLSAFILIVIITASFVILFNLPKNNKTNKAKEDPIITNIVNTATKTSVYSGKLAMKINEKTINSNVKLIMSPEVKFDITLDLSNLGINNSINIKYLDNFAYITIDSNSRYKFNASTITNDLPFLKEIITNNKPEIEQNISSSVVSTNTTTTDATQTNRKDILEYLGININSFDFSAIDTSSLSSLLDNIKTSETKIGYNVALNIDNTISAQATFDKEYKLEEFSTGDIRVADTILSLDFVSDGKTNLSVTKPTAEYIDLTNSVDIIKLVKTQIDDSFSASIDMKVSSTQIYGTLLSSRTTPYKANLSLLVGNTNLSIQIEDTTWYLTFGKSKTYGTYSQIKTALGQLFSSNTNLQGSFNKVLELLNSIVSIENNNSKINILTTKGMDISFASKEDQLISISVNTKSMSSKVSFYKLTKAIPSINKSAFTPNTAIMSLTQTNKEGNSFLTKISSLLFTSKPNFNIAVTMNDISFNGNIGLNLDNGDVRYLLDGKLTLSNKTYTLKVQQSTNATLFTFGSMNAQILNSSETSWYNALTKLTGFNFNNLAYSLKNASSLADFGGVITGSTPIMPNEIMEIINNTSVLTINNISSISYKTNSGATAKIQYNLNSNVLTFNLSNLKLSNQSITISATMLSEKTISRVSANSSYLNISQLAELISATKNTYDSSNILRISGPLYVTLPLIGEISINVYAQIRKEVSGYSVVILLDRLPTGIYMNTSVYTTAVANGQTRHYSYIYIRNGKIFFERYVDYQTRTKIGGGLFNPEYRYSVTTKPISSGYFTISDITQSTEQTLSYLNEILGVGKLVLDSVNLFGTNKKIGTIDKDLDKLIASKGYSYASNKHNIVLDMNYITGNKDFSNITLSVSVQSNKIYQFGIKFSIGSVMKLNATYFKPSTAFLSNTFTYANTSKTTNIQSIMNTKMNYLRNGTIQSTLTSHIQH